MPAVTSSGLGCIHDGTWLKQILPNSNIRNVLGEYEDMINIFTELTADSVLDREEFGGPRKKNSAVVLY